MNEESLADLRRDYARATLDKASVDADPLRQFKHWIDQARSVEAVEPNAMTLATVAPNGTASARIVLLKGLDAGGFVFFTNYQSSKGQHLALNPQAALVFLWQELERQVRIEGEIEKISAAESQTYFSSRPRASQIGALASDQSQVVANRSVLEHRFQALESQYEDNDIPKPEHWGGYRLIPSMLEFWQGRRSRLHDRIRYRRKASSVDWIIERLQP